MKVLGGAREVVSRERVLVFLLLVSLGIKVTILLSGGIINIDGVRYISAARHFSEGDFLEGLRIDWMPFYALLIAAFHFLIRDWVLAGQLISLFSLVLAMIPLFLLTRDLFDEKVAFWTGLVFALSPMLNEHAVGLLRDPAFLFFVAWSIYFCWRALQTGKIRFFTLASLSTIFALLFRLEAVLILVVCLSVLAVLAIKNREERPLFLKGMSLLVGLPLALGLLLGGGTLLVAGPEVVSSSQLGENGWQLKEVVTKNSVSYYKRKVNRGILETYRSRYETLKDLAKALPGWNRTGGLLETTRHYLPLIYLIGAAEALARNLFPLFVLPLVAGLRKHPVFNRGHWLVLLSVGAYFMLTYYFLFIHDWIAKRYVLVPALLLLPWVGRGLERIWSGISGWHVSRVAMVLFLLVFCGIPAYKSLGDHIGSRQVNVHKAAGTWLSMQADFQNSVVACSDPRIRFYSSPKMKFIREMEKSAVARDFGKMEKMALDNKADLLIVETSAKKRKHVPEFRDFSLLKEFAGVENVVLIYCRTGQNPAL